jgi:Na+/H+ antiporter NhaD and related arsenite permeases
MTEWVHLTIAAFLGALLLVFTNVMTLNEAIGYIGAGYSTIALFFGVMVLVRSFEPTKIFDYLAVQMVVLARGKGSRLLLAIVGITSLVSQYRTKACKGRAGKGFIGITNFQL